MLKTEGFDELQATLSRMGTVGNRIGNKALKEGAKIMQGGQEMDAPKDRPEGFKYMNIGRVRTYKDFDKYVSVGIIRAKKAPWDSVRGVYFQHTGYKQNGKYYAGKFHKWMDKSRDKNKSKATEVIKKMVIKELFK